MAIGDVGGPVTELAIMCKVAAGIKIKKDDAVALVGPYEVATYGNLFGQALENAKSGDSVAVRVRGVCVFYYLFEGFPPEINDSVHICTSGHVVILPERHYGINHILKVDEEHFQVHVLL